MSEPLKFIASLRDEFAKAALIGLMSRNHVGLTRERMAIMAYEYADEMLKARGAK